MKPKFKLGKTIIAPEVSQSIPQEDIQDALRRHAAGDWGILCKEDQEQNLLALEHDMQLVSTYRSSTGKIFWITTEDDRSITRVLPEDDELLRGDDAANSDPGTESSPATTQRFKLGQVVITPGALQCLTHQDVEQALRRHACGDWGELSENDREENEYSVNRSLRLLSAYRTADGTKFWVITEADRSATTLLLPDDY